MIGKIKRGIFISAIAISISVTNLHIAEATEQNNIKFIDVDQNHWATDDIYWAVNQGIIKGYKDGTFRGNLQITESEFVSLLYNYASNTNKNVPRPPKGTHWAQNYYNELKKYELPLKGYGDNKAKNTAITRGDIARVIAAKYGFNLSEENAILFMYENDLSSGLISGQMTLNSYGKDQPVLREQLPAFIKKMNDKGYTTFKGKQSSVGADGIAGIPGVPQDNSPADFGKLPGNQPQQPGNSTFKYAEPIANKYGYKVDASSDGTGYLIADSSFKHQLIFDKNDKGSIGSLCIYGYSKNKELSREILNASGTVPDASKLIGYIDQHLKTFEPKFYSLGDGRHVRISGNDSKIYLWFGAE